MVLSTVALGAVAVTPPAGAEPPLDPAAAAEARFTASRPGQAAASLQFDILFDRVGSLEVEEVSCRRAGELRFHCKFLVAAYDGLVWRGGGRMRAHAFEGRSFRYFYRLSARRKSCTFGMPLRCDTRKFVWRGESSRVSFPAPH